MYQLKLENKKLYIPRTSTLNQSQPHSHTKTYLPFTLQHFQRFPIRVASHSIAPRRQSIIQICRIIKSIWFHSFREESGLATQLSRYTVTNTKCTSSHLRRLRRKLIVYWQNALKLYCLLTTFIIIVKSYFLFSSLPDNDGSWSWGDDRRIEDWHPIDLRKGNVANAGKMWV